MLFGKPAFDLAELDAKPPDLHLVVDTAVKQDAALGIEAHRIAGTIEDRIGAIRRKRIGDELLRRQLRPLQIALRDSRSADQQLALLARRYRRQILGDDPAGIVRDRSPDGDRLARLHLVHRRDHGRFRRPIGVEQAPVRLRPARGERRRQCFSAEQDEAQARHVPADHREQCRHHVDDGDAVRVEHIGKLVALRHEPRVGDEQRRADEIGDPDFLHRQIEGEGGALEHHVIGTNAVDLVRRSQEMTDVPLSDDDALRLAGGAGGVDHIGGMVRREARRAPFRQRGRVRCGERRIDENGCAGGLRPLHERGAGQQGLGAAIGEAFADALDRGLRIEGKPGGAAHRDADLGDQQLGAARHPQADDMAGPDAALRERRADGARPELDLGIGEGAGRPDERPLVGMRGGRGGEELAEHLVVDEVGSRGSAQHGRRQLVAHGIVGKDAPIHRVHRRPFRLGASARTRPHLLRNQARFAIRPASQSGLRRSRTIPLPACLSAPYRGSASGTPVHRPEPFRPLLSGRLHASQLISCDETD